MDDQDVTPRWMADYLLNCGWSGEAIPGAYARYRLDDDGPESLLNVIADLDGPHLVQVGTPGIDRYLTHYGPFPTAAHALSAAVLIESRWALIAEQEDPSPWRATVHALFGPGHYLWPDGLEHP